MINRRCTVHRHLSWVPVHQHHVWPLGMGGPDEPANLIPICPNGHYAIHKLLDLMLDLDGSVPWFERRQFGRQVRHYAVLGYQQILANRQETNGDPPR